MNNVYLIYGEDEYLIKHNINKIKKDFDLENIIYYDLEVDLLDDVIEELNTLGLFGKKLVICNNSSFLSRQKSIQQDTDKFIKYLDNINTDTVLVLVTNSIDNTKKVVKKLKTVTKVITCNSYDKYELIEIIKKKFNHEGYKIYDDAIHKIIDLTLSDMNLINNEINKLLMYKFDEKVVTLDDVMKLVSEKLDDNIFELIDAVTLRDEKNIFKIYSKLINVFNYDSTKILSMIANQFRLILRTKVMIDNRMSEKEIADKLNVHPYRIKLANQKSKKLSYDVLTNYLFDLSEIDYKIKSGLSNKNASLELFFL